LQSIISRLSIPALSARLSVHGCLQNLDLWPFAQAPRYVDEQIALSQSNTIMRYLGAPTNIGWAAVLVFDMLLQCLSQAVCSETTFIASCIALIRPEA
jgi:hypothetical protein